MRSRFADQTPAREIRMPGAAMPVRLNRRIAALVLGLAIGAGTASPALAQVAALVNGDPITVLDVTQRIRLTEISTHKQQSREDALDELIKEKLKLQIAKRYIINITDKDVDNAFNSMAQHAGLTGQQFSDALSKAGISVPALKARVRADIGWNAIIRGKFQGSLEVGEKEVLAAVQARKKDDKPEPAFQFRLRQILFIVPRGSPENAFEARKKEAEALRARFEKCEDGIRLALTLRDVTVRDAITRTSLDVPVKQRQILDGTPIGRLTPPEATRLGVETFAVCSREETRGGGSAEEREVRAEIVNQRYEVQSKRYLEELRRSSMIEIR